MDRVNMGKGMCEWLRLGGRKNQSRERRAHQKDRQTQRCEMASVPGDGSELVQLNEEKNRR